MQNALHDGALTCGIGRCSIEGAPARVCPPCRPHASCDSDRMDGHRPEANGGSAHVPSPESATPARARLPRRRARSPALTGLFILALLTALHVSQEVLMPVALSILFALILRPIVRLLHRWRIPEPLGAGVAVLGVVGLLTLTAFHLYGPALEWAERAPEMVRAVAQRFRTVGSPMAEVGRAAEEVEQLAQTGDEHVPVVAIQGEDLKTKLAWAALVGLGWALVITVLVYFLLATHARLLHKALALLVEESQRTSRASVVMETERNLSRYLFTIAAKNTVLGLSVAASMWAWGMPNPLLWGAMAGMLNFIPYLGDLTGISITAMVAFVSIPDLRWIGVPVSYLILTNIEGLLITPAIIGRRFALDPVVVFVWIIFWGWLWGIGGALLAMPMLVTLRILSERSSALAALGLLISNRETAQMRREPAGRAD